MNKELQNVIEAINCATRNTQDQKLVSILAKELLASYGLDGAIQQASMLTENVDLRKVMSV